MPAPGDPPPSVARKENRAGGATQISYVPQPSPRLATRCQIDVHEQHQRQDGRKTEEMRPCHLRLGAVPHATGSAYIQQGQTKIFAAVFGPRQAADRTSATAEGMISVDLHFAPFCSQKFSRDDNDKRAALYSAILQRSIESIILLDRYAKTIFDINLLVIEDDGAALTAAISVASLALADANVEMRELAAGVTLHLTKSADPEHPRAFILLDCDGVEEEELREDSAVLHIGFCSSKRKLCLMHSTGPTPSDHFERMVMLAKDAAEVISNEMRSCLERRATRRAAKRARIMQECENAMLLIQDAVEPMRIEGSGADLAFPDPTVPRGSKIPDSGELATQAVVDIDEPMSDLITLKS